MEKKMETTIVYWGNIMEKKIETIAWLGIRIYSRDPSPPFPVDNPKP